MATAVIKARNGLETNKTSAEEGDDGDGTGVVVITGKFKVAPAA